MCETRQDFFVDRQPEIESYLSVIWNQTPEPRALCINNGTLLIYTNIGEGGKGIRDIIYDPWLHFAPEALEFFFFFFFFGWTISTHSMHNYPADVFEV